jgi:hypothetical protein
MTPAQGLLEKAKRDVDRCKENVDNIEDELTSAQSRLDRALKDERYWNEIVNLEKARGLTIS